MRTVKVAKEDLIRRIQSNMEKHREEFETGLETYRNAVVQELEDWLEKAKKGKRVTAYTQLRAPEDHMEDYRQVLDMLKMSVDSEIELTHQEFSQFEPPRYCRRLQSLRGWGHEQAEEVFSRSTGAGVSGRPGAVHNGHYRRSLTTRVGTVNWLSPGIGRGGSERNCSSGTSGVRKPSCSRCWRW